MKTTGLHLWRQLPFILVILMTLTKYNVSHPINEEFESKLKYEEGKAYIYDFESTSTIEMNKIKTEVRGIHVKGQFILTPLTFSNFLLQIKENSIQCELNKAGDFKILEGSSLKFNYNNGKIGTLWMDKKDPTWSVNVKRALVSSLQNQAIENPAMEFTAFETDILGHCSTRYTVSGSTYVKTKNFTTCANNFGGVSVSRGVRYSLNAKEVDLYDTPQTCTQIVDNFLIQNVTCQESHNLPKDLQVQAKSTIYLSLSSVQTSDHDPNIDLKVNTLTFLNFNHSGEVPSPLKISRQKSASDSTTTILEKMCPEIEMDATDHPSKLPALFLDLKKTVYFMTQKDLQSILGQIRSQQLCRGQDDAGVLKLENLFLDACAMSAGDGAIGLLGQLYIKKELTWVTKSNFYFFTTFASQPSELALTSMIELLTTEAEPEVRLLLTISGLLRQFCKMENSNCPASSEYSHLVNLMVAKGKAFSGNVPSGNIALGILESFTNLEYLTPQAVAFILKGLSSDQERIQIKALESFSRHPCQQELKDGALDFLDDVKKNAGIRIQAFLAVANCLESRNVDQIQSILDQDESLQVKTFISSYIQNQLKVSSPFENPKMKVLKEFEIPAQEIQDDYLISRNIHWSTLSSDHDLGFDSNLNLIFLENSIPKLISQNLTIHFAGRSYNLIETNLYLEDFEQYLGNFMTLLNIFFRSEKSKPNYPQLNFFLEEARHSKSVTPLSSRSPKQIEPNPSSKSWGHVSVKLMGNSILLEDINFGSMYKSLLGFWDKILQDPKSKSPHKIDLTLPILFLNEELTLPTISGFPLNFNLELIRLYTLQMKGHDDLGQLLIDDNVKDAKAKYVFSSATFLRLRMTIGSQNEAYFIGLKGLGGDGLIYTGGGIEGQVKRHKNKIDVFLQLPQNKTRAFNFQSDWYWVEKKAGEIEKSVSFSTPIPQTKIYDSCKTDFDLGLKFCLDFKMPRHESDSRWAPYTMAVYMEKINQTIQGYHLQLDSQLNDEHLKYYWLRWDVIGGAKKSEIGAQWNLTQSLTQDKLEVKVKLPFNEWKSMCQTDFSKTLKGLTMSINDGRLEWIFRAQMSITDSDYLTYEPLIQYSNPWGLQKYLQGYLRYSDNEILVKLTSDPGQFYLFRPLQGMITAEIKLKASEKRQLYHLEKIQLSYPSGPLFDLRGNLSVTPGEIELKGIAFTGLGQNILINSNLTVDLKNQDNQKLLLKTKLTASENEGDLLLDLFWEGQVKSGTMVHDFILYSGRGKDKLSVVLEQSFFQNKLGGKVETFNKFQVKQESKDLDLELDFNAKTKEKLSDSAFYEFEIRGGDSHQFVLEIQEGDTPFLLDYNFMSLIKYPGQSYELKEKAKLIDPDNWQFNSKYIEKPGREYHVITALTLKDNGENDAENSISTVITNDLDPFPITFKCGAIKTVNSTTSHLYLKAQEVKLVDFSTELIDTSINSNQSNSLTVKAFVHSYLNAVLIERHFYSENDSNLILNIDAHSLQNDWKLTGQSSVTSMSQDSNLNLTGNFHLAPNSGEAVALQLTGILSRDFFNGTHDVTLVQQRNQNDIKIPPLPLVAIHLTNSLTNSEQEMSTKSDLLIKTLIFDLSWVNKLENYNEEKLTGQILSDFNVYLMRMPFFGFMGQVSSQIPRNSTRVVSGIFGVDGVLAGSGASKYGGSLEWDEDNLNTTMSLHEKNRLSTLELTTKLNEWRLDEGKLNYAIKFPKYLKKTLRGTLNVPQVIQPF